MMLIEDLLIVYETDAALLVEDCDGKKYWLPKSQIEYSGYIDDIIDIEIPEWLALEKGLI